MKNRFQMLIEANHTLARIESLDELLSQLMVLVKEITEAVAASVMLYNPEKQVLEFKSIKDEVIGEKGGDILMRTVELKLGEGIAGWVAANRESLIIQDAQNDERLFRMADEKTGFVTRTLIAVPILHQDELLGVIEAINSKRKQSFEPEDRDILESFANLAAVAIVRSRLMESRVEQKMIQVQLDTASKIQALFLPRASDVKTMENIWALSEPAGSVGGDLYDIIPMQDESICFYVGDVSDKGLASALIMAALSARIRGEVHIHENVAELLDRVNKAMYDLISEENYFATLVVGKYWPETGRMHLADAGHLPPLWVVKNGLDTVPLIKGLPLGIAYDITYHQVAVNLSPGEGILFYTDGITEAENQNGELFGDRRVEDCIKEKKTPPWGRNLVDRVKAWRGNAEANDDLTILEIWR